MQTVSYGFVRYVRGEGRSTLFRSFYYHRACKQGTCGDNVGVPSSLAVRRSARGDGCYSSGGGGVDARVESNANGVALTCGICSAGGAEHVIS